MHTYSDVDRLVWEKLICNVAFSATCAVIGATIGAVIDDPAAWSVATACARPTTSRRRSNRRRLQRPVAYVHAFGSAIPVARPSMLLDVHAGRPSEIAVINGSIPPLAQGLGVPAPVNTTRPALVHAIERAGTAPLPRSG